MHSDTERLHSDSPPAVEIGATILGKYQIIGMIGSGAMGQVFEGHHIGLDKRVALKFLMPELVGNKECVERFSREARAAALIKSEHVVDISDVGTLANGTPFMVMELLAGMDLEAWSENNPSPPVTQVVDLVLQACEGIAEAHTRHIVHRDLKPANLFLTDHGGRADFVKVLDFGISKVRTDKPKLTQTGQTLGTVLYMAPEQLLGEHVDTRADVWAIGVILYELICGSMPFNGMSVGAITVAVLAPPLPLRTHRPDVPAQLEQVILRCLKPDLTERMQSVAELAIALLPFTEHSRASIDNICRVTGFPPPAPTGAASPVQDAVPRRRAGNEISRTTKALIFVGASIACGVGIGAIAIRYKGADDNETTDHPPAPIQSVVIPVETLGPIVPTDKPRNPPDVVPTLCSGDGDCDALSGGTCVHARCENQWAAWPISDAASDTASAAASYTDNGDGTVTDNLTRLMWEKVPSGKPYSWGAARAHCTKSSLADHLDWRLPSQIELVSIVDHTRSKPAIDVRFFPAGQRMRYWSSTPVDKAEREARFVEFSDGSTFSDPVTETRGARCVR